jgi:hypothetical protein
VPQDLCGNTSSSHWLPSQYRQSLPSYIDPSNGRSRGYCKEENQLGDDKEKTRLNEQGALFLLSFRAVSVQASKAAVNDVLGAEIESAFQNVLSN